MNQKQSRQSAKAHSRTKGVIQKGERVYSFRSDIDNQYHVKGTYYIQDVGPEKSFSLGGKSDVKCYIDGNERQNVTD